MRGAPRPAGRISKSRCGAFFAVVLPMRPSIVPPRTRAPLRSALGLEVARVEAERRAGELGRVAGGLELGVAAGGERVRAARVGEQALLVAARRSGAPPRRLRRRPWARLAGRRGPPARAVRARCVSLAGRVGLRSLGQVELAADLGLASPCASSAPGRSRRPSPGARRCRCCRRRPGAGRSGRGACCGRA